MTSGSIYVALVGGDAVLVRAFRTPVVACGGVSSGEHLWCQAKLGVEDAIVGRALYDGGLGLEEALAAVRS